MKRAPLLSTLFCVSSIAFLALLVSFQKSASAYPAPQKQIEIPISTDERLEVPGWWPTKQSASLDDFVGTQECARCHAKIVATQLETPMARAASLPADAAPLREHDRLVHPAGPYTFTISKDGPARTYTVTDGARTISAPLGWAFGLGNKGQTYVFWRNGAFYESQMSFFTSLHSLDLTPGHSPKTPPTLEQALGQPLDPDITRRCFGCHTTAATTRAGFHPSGLVLGVDCEACHGPGAKHADLMDAEKNAEGRQAIFDPATLGPVAQVDFCGACHRTSDDAAATKLKGVETTRFQPYRLEKSRCWSGGDPRLTCTACHNPHEPLNHDPAAYDAKCLACHATSHPHDRRSPDRPLSQDNPPTEYRRASFVITNRQPGPLRLFNLSILQLFNSSTFQLFDSLTPAPSSSKACPVASKNCVTCHMPRVDVPSMHSPFVDHRIRIVRPNSPYPN